MKGFRMAEIYTGHVRDGVVVFDEGTPPLPEGTKVQVELADQKTSLRSLSAGLRGLAGRAEGLPEDMAENLDHYLHGHPKK
jgi:hypothetical protein